MHRLFQNIHVNASVHWSQSTNYLDVLNYVLFHSGCVGMNFILWAIVLRFCLLLILTVLCIFIYELIIMVYCITKLLNQFLVAEYSFFCIPEWLFWVDSLFTQHFLLSLRYGVRRLHFYLLYIKHRMNIDCQNIQVFISHKTSLNWQDE